MPSQAIGLATLKRAAIKTAAATAVTYGLYKLAHYIALDDTTPFSDDQGNLCRIENTAHVANLERLSSPGSYFAIWHQQQKRLLDANTELLPWGKWTFALGATAGFLKMLAIKKIVTNSTFRNWAQKYSTPKQVAIVSAISLATMIGLHVCPATWLGFNLDHKIRPCYPHAVSAPYYLGGTLTGMVACGLFI